MALARRKFLKSSLVFGASALMIWANTHSGFARTLMDDGNLPEEVLNDPLYRFTKETFEPYVGGYFQAPDVRGEMVALKLVKVEGYAPKSESPSRNPVGTDSFSLLFSAENALPRFQNIHPIKHGALGDFRLFLTRRDDERGQITYEAVFNRLR